MNSIWNRIYKTVQKIFIRSTDRLVKKLFMIFTLVIIMIIVLQTVISYTIIENDSKKNIISSNANNLMLVNNNFEGYIDEINELSLPQLKYDHILNAIIHESEDYTAKAYLQDYLRSLFYSRKDIEGIYYYLIEQNKYYYISRAEDDIAVKTKDDGEVKKQYWYKKVIESNKHRYIQSLLLNGDSGYLNNNKKCFMAYHRAFINITNKKPLAVISFYLNSSARDEILKDIPLDEGDKVYLCDDNNQPFYFSDKSIYTDMQNTVLINGIKALGSSGHLNWGNGNDSYLAIYNTSEKDKWKLNKFIPYNKIYKTAKINSKINYIIGSIFLVISPLLVMLISSAITRPMKKLRRNMQKFGEGNFNVEANIKGRDEIAQLSNQFNLMVKKIDELINEKYRKELIEKRAVLKALEAEINPHFLYNALQAVSTKALKSGALDIVHMVDSLALTFRYCINGIDVVSVKDEINHIENYMVLQKARFGKRLQIIYELDEYAYEIKIPKLSIHTLVENSVKHALESITSILEIVISIHMDNQRAVITVRDNGPGISADRIGEITKWFNEDMLQGEIKSVGLKNLNKRLELILGAGTNLDIVSDKTGTQISFIVPIGG